MQNTTTNHCQSFFMRGGGGGGGKEVHVEVRCHIVYDYSTVRIDRYR